MALFEGTEDSEVTVDQLVGEGKKYKTVDDLARSRVIADRTIQEREQELAGLRDELKTRLAVEEQLKQFQKATTQPDEGNQTRQPETPASGDQNDLAKRVKEIVEQDRADSLRKANQTVVQERLLELYGTPEKASQIVRAKAQELGVTVQFLESIAFQSPKAFFTQLGAQEVPGNQRPNVPSRGGVNTEALGQYAGTPKEGSYEFFEQIRKTNPTLYWDAKTQTRIHKAAMEGLYNVPDPVYDL